MSSAAERGAAAYQAAAKGSAIGAAIGSALGPQGAVVGAAAGAIVGGVVSLGDWLGEVFASEPDFVWTSDGFGRRFMPRGWSTAYRMPHEQRGRAGELLWRFRRALEDGASRSEALAWLARELGHANPEIRVRLARKASDAAEQEARARRWDGWDARRALGPLAMLRGRPREVMIASLAFKWLRRQGVDALTAAQLVASAYGAGAFDAPAGLAARLEHARRVYLGGQSDQDDDDDDRPAPRAVRLSDGARRLSSDDDDDDDDDQDDEGRPFRVARKRREIPQLAAVAPPQLAPIGDPMQREIVIPLGKYQLTIRQVGDRVMAWADVPTPWGPVRVCAMASIDTIRGAMSAARMGQLMDAIAGDEVDVGAENVAWGRVAARAALAAGQNPKRAGAVARVAHARLRARDGSPAARRSLNAAKARARVEPRAASIVRDAARARTTSLAVFPYLPDPSRYRPGWR